MPNPDGSLTPEEQAQAAGGVPQGPSDGTLTDPTAYMPPTAPVAPGAPQTPPQGTGDPLLDFAPPGSPQGPPAQPAPFVPSADAVPMHPVAFPRGAVKSETTVASPEMRQGYEKGQAVAKDEQRLAHDQSELDKEKARITQENQEAADSERASQAAEAQAQLQANKDAREAREAKYLADIQEAKAFARSPSGSESDPSWRKNLSLLSVVLGQSGRAALGGENPGQRILDNRIKQEFENKKLGLESRYKELELTHGYNTEIENAAKDDYVKLLAAQKVRLDDLAAHGIAQLSALGVPQAQIAANQTILGIQQKAAQAEQEYGKVISSKVEAKPLHTGAGGGGGVGSLSALQEFARQNPGPENTSKVTALAERLFPGMKPAQLQSLVGGAIKLDADVAAGGRNSAPKVYRDTLTGKDLPVDANATDRVAHDHAKAVLAPVNTFIKTAEDLVERSKNPNAPAWVARFGSSAGGDAAQAQADVKRLRSAYAKAKGESIGEGNAKELAEAIPDVPTWPATKATMDNWRKVTKSYIDEMWDLRRENLANAGIKPGDGTAMPKGEGGTKVADSGGRKSFDDLAKEHGL